jgi:hypothetical protein
MAMENQVAQFVGSIETTVLRRLKTIQEHVGDASLPKRESIDLSGFHAKRKRPDALRLQ